MSSVRRVGLQSMTSVELASLRLLPSQTVRDLILILRNSLPTGLGGRAAMQAEIIALRHQLTVLHHKPRPKRVRLNNIDRCLWIWLSRWWANRRSALIIVKPETVSGEFGKSRGDGV
jgi:hypothetical protein